MGKPKKKLSAYNRYMSKALKGKMTGKTKAQRKAIFKAAAKGWKKGKSTPGSSKPKSRASPSRGNPTGGTRTMSRRNSFSMAKIYKAVRIVSLAAPGVMTALRTDLSPEHKIQKGLAMYTGVSPDGTFRLSDLKMGWEPFFWASIVTSVVPKLISFVKGIF
ncbi:unnamed protein product [marine sediment metagenome]|uniref:Uncharacterized protein n=1 Tax=marine sediment metagenome TaxID=412755 RepID=X1NR21_9ZZZZ